MANYSSLLSLSVCFLVLFHGCFAQIEQVVNQGQSPRQQPRQRFQTQCRLRNLNAVQPRHRFRSEAGVTEFWDQNEEQFQCAGVAFLRHTIERKGLLLPSYNNAPQLIFVVRGQGIQGVVLPGCPETYQTQVQQGQGQQQSSRDQHQKLRQFKEGDVLALPAGVPHWIHNNGQSQLVLVSLIDVGNNNNQLDQFFRKFFLAGNPQQGIVTGGQRRNGEQSPRHRGQEEEQQEEEQRESGGNNVFSPLDENALAASLGIDTSLARKLKNNNDRRGAIVRMEHDFQLTSPQRAEREQRQQSEGEEEEEEESEQEEERGERRESRRRRGHEGRTTNGLEETFCTMRMKQRTDSSFPDIFNPRAGRITTVNSFNLPILQQLQLSAERGVLYRNAFYAPHWNVDAHSIVYITKGNGRVQIVSENGENVLDERVEEGQVFVVPQNFVVLKNAGERGLEWIAFKTNANANISPIAGRGSFLSGTPVEVLSKAFGISTEAAFRLKQGRQEQSLFGPRQQHQYY